MEAWAIIALVLGSDAIILLGNWLLMKRQLKHSESQLDKRMLGEKEERKHERRRIVRSEPLLKLRIELSDTVEKIESMVDYAIQIVDEKGKYSDEGVKRLNKSIEVWNEYLASGEFFKALHMQYEKDLKREAHRIYMDYQNTFLEVEPFLKGGKGDEKVRAARDAMRRYSARASEIQSKINELLEEL